VSLWDTKHHTSLYYKVEPDQAVHQAWIVDGGAKLLLLIKQTQKNKEDLTKLILTQSDLKGKDVEIYATANDLDCFHMDEDRTRLFFKEKKDHHSSLVSHYNAIDLSNGSLLFTYSCENKEVFYVTFDLTQDLIMLLFSDSSAGGDEGVTILNGTTGAPVYDYRCSSKQNKYDTHTSIKGSLFLKKNDVQAFIITSDELVGWSGLKKKTDDITKIVGYLLSGEGLLHADAPSLNSGRQGNNDQELKADRSHPLMESQAAMDLIEAYVGPSPFEIRCPRHVSGEARGCSCNVQ
jgi:hypothetical protein